MTAVLIVAGVCVLVVLYAWWDDKKSRAVNTTTDRPNAAKETSR